ADPDRARDVASLELDPDAGALLGQEGDADTLPRVGHAGFAPARHLAVQRPGDPGLDPERLRIDLGDGPRVLAVPPIQPLSDVLEELGDCVVRHPARPPNSPFDPLVAGGPTALR